MYEKLFSSHAEILKALAHPRRLEIIQLIRNQELSVTDIHTMLDLPQANISQHLSILREAGVVQTKKVGKQIHYSLLDERILKACDLIREVLINQDQAEFIEAQFPLTELVPLTTDPVCGMRVSPKTTNFHVMYDKEQFSFCASGCLKKFQEDPHQYV